MKRLYFAICMLPSLALAEVDPKWEETETKLVYNIELCRITASHFDENEHSQWEEIKTSYLDARPKTQPESETWTDLKKVMLYAQSAENDTKRRLENLSPQELYIHEECYDKRSRFQNEAPWVTLKKSTK